MPYIGRQTTQGEFIKLDSIQAGFNGSTTTFDLKATGQAYSPGAANALLVSLAGIIQESGIAYTVDDSQITFTAAPILGTEAFILAMGSRVNVGTPSAGTINGSTLVDGSVGTNKIAGGSITAAKLDSNFGTFSGTISATAFAGDGSAITGIANTGDVNAGTLNVAGVTTVGSGITLSPDGDGFFTGVVTATSYAGDGSALTGIAATANVRTGILDVTGIATFRDNLIATTASFSSDVSIGGTLTYEDVTNVDSVGLITARNGIVVGSGITLSSDGDVFAVGVSTFNSNVLVGSGITLSPDGDGFFSGITTITSGTFGGGVLQENYDDHGALTGTYNHDAHTHGMILRSVTNASASFVINLRGDASTTFGSLFPYPKATTMTIYSPSNNASYYMTAFQIDGSAQTVKWSGGSAPSAGTGSGVDVYSMTILALGSNTYEVYGNFSNFA